ncbi:MAG: helix-turn-helix domain-containing protein [Fibrobacterota bacterium]
MARERKKKMAGNYYREDFFEKSGMPLFIIDAEAHQSTLPHGHDFTELVIVREGRGVHLEGNEQYPIVAGDAFVIHEREQHGYADVSGLAITNILFDPVPLGFPAHDMRGMAGYQALFALEPSLRQRHGLRSPLRMAPRDLLTAVVLKDHIRKELTDKAEGFRAMAAALFSQLVLFLSRNYGKGKETDAVSLLRLGSALCLLEDRYAERVRLCDLAHAAGMSQSSFQRAFRRALDCSPIDYLIRYRVRKAAELLRDPALRITEIGFKSGFEDSNYFSRQFKAVMGMSPRRYRAQGG